MNRFAIHGLVWKEEERKILGPRQRQMHSQREPSDGSGLCRVVPLRQGARHRQGEHGWCSNLMSLATAGAR